MQDVFVTPPGWSWDIVLYFFFGGMAGGLFFLGSMLRLVGRAEDRPLSRIAYYLAFPLLLVCTILLIKDLGRPDRFWHMVFQSERLPLLMFKWWSPISFGTWILSFFGLLSVISFIFALTEAGVLRSPGLRRLTGALHRPESGVGALYLVVAALWGLLLAGYTGMLIMANNVPTWSHDPFLPPLVMSSGVATAAAAIFLLSWASGLGEASGRRRVLRTGAMALAFEAVMLLGSIVVGLGGVSPFFLGWWTALFWIVILPFGVVLPLVLLSMALFRDRELVRNAAVVGASLVLVGGILLRLLEVLGGQSYYVPY